MEYQNYFSDIKSKKYPALKIKTFCKKVEAVKFFINDFFKPKFNILLG